MITLTGTGSIELPNPILNDGNEFRIQTRFKKSMRGDINTYKYTAMRESFILVFNTLSQSLVTSLLAFIRNNIGTEVTYTDYVGSEFTVVINTNPFEFARLLDGSSCEYNSVTLELETCP